MMFIFLEYISGLSTKSALSQCPLWVVCGLMISAIERPLFHTNYYKLVVCP